MSETENEEMMEVDDEVHSEITEKDDNINHDLLHHADVLGQLFETYLSGQKNSDEKQQDFNELQRLLSVKEHKSYILLPVKIPSKDNMTVKCIVDTGSKYSLISSNFVSTAQENLIDKTKEKIELTGINAYRTSGFIPLLVINIDGKKLFASVHILDALNKKDAQIFLILGMDFLLRNNVLIDFGTQTFMIPWAKLKIAF